MRPTLRLVTPTPAAGTPVDAAADYPNRPLRDPQPRKKRAPIALPPSPALERKPAAKLEPSARFSNENTLKLLRRIRANDSTRLQDNGPICVAYMQRQISEADFEYLNAEFSKFEAGEKVTHIAPAPVRTRTGKKPVGLRAREHGGATRYFWAPPAQLGGKLVRLHGTTEEIAERCRQLQVQALRQIRLAIPAHIASAPRFTGTLGSLIRIYLADRTSPFHKLRPGTQENYRRGLRAIDARHGDRRLATLGRHDFFDWHAKWIGADQEHIAAGDAKINLLKVLFKFGIGQFAHCDRLRLIMSGLTFEKAQGRDVWPTREQVNAVRRVAHEEGHHEYAFGLAVQFEAGLRPKDVFGEWLKNLDGAPNLPSVCTTRAARWSGLVWGEHIDADLILAKPTSKSNFVKVAVHDLMLLPMVVAEMQRAYPGCITEERAAKGPRKPPRLVLHRELLPQSGPVILDPDTGKPWTDSKRRRMWRRFARKAGLPECLQSRDLRSGAATEASNLEVDLEHVRQFLGHSNIRTTQGYNRDQLAKSRIVARARAAALASRGKTARPSTRDATAADE